MRVALYCRVSTDRQNVQLQVDALRRVAAQREYTVVGEYIDDGVSGAKDTRPALDRMMADARAAKFDIVLVTRMDRLGRSLIHLVGLMQDLTTAGVGFASVADAGIDTTSASGRMMLHVLAAIAEFERSLILERIAVGVAKARAEGKRFGRPEVPVPALDAAVVLVRAGHSLKMAARSTGTNRATLRRRLEALGEWPPRVQNSTTEKNVEVALDGVQM